MNQHRIAAPNAPPENTDQVLSVDGLLDAVDDRQAVALAEWLRLSVDGAPPCRSSFRPERIVRALPISTLVAVEWNGNDPIFRARIEGQMVTIAFGEARGRSFAETYAPAHLDQVLPAFREAACHGRVSLTSAITRTGDGEPFAYSRLLLPFADAGGRVARILAAYGFPVSRLRSLTEPLDIGDVIPAQHTRRQAAGYLRLKTA